MNQLREKLEPYDLHRPSKLASKLGNTIQYASQLLGGRSYGPSTAERIAEILQRMGHDITWETVYRWRNDGNAKKKRKK